MDWSFPLYSGVFFLGSALALVLAAALWSRRRAPGAMPLTFFALAVAEWSLTRALEAGAVGVPAQIFWGKAQYFGVLSVGVLWLSFAMDYSGIVSWRHARILVLMWAIPAVSLVLAWTNEIHGLIWSSITPTGTDTILNWAHGPWFWVAAVFNYSAMLAGIILLARHARGKAGIYRRQVIVLLVGTAVPLVGNAIYLLGLSPVKGLDLTPFAFAVAASIYGVTLFRYRFMDVVPVARTVVIENMPDAILVLDNRDRLVDMNPSAEKMLAITARGNIGRPINEVWAAWAEVESCATGNGHGELALDANGMKSLLDVTVTALHGGRFVAGRVIVLRDVTERRRMELALREEINRRTNYTRALVHELKTPLTAIIASSELLETEVGTGITEALLKNIRRSAMNLESRIKDLVDLAKGEIGTINVKLRPIETLDLLRNVTEEMKPVASTKGLCLALEAPETLPPALADETRLRQILYNIVGNAVKFTATGGITIRASRDDATLVIQVIDTGPGIDSEDIAYIFDPYRHTRHDNEFLGGMGIGLALCKLFVELQHGQIWAESGVGKGTTFSFTVPISTELAETTPDQSGPA